MPVVLILIAFVAVGLLGLWVGQFILSFRDLLRHRNDAVERSDSILDVPPEDPPTVMGWGDPLVWLLAFLLWPMFVAAMFDAWWRDHSVRLIHHEERAQRACAALRFRTPKR